MLSENFLWKYTPPQTETLGVPNVNVVAATNISTIAAPPSATCFACSFVLSSNGEQKADCSNPYTIEKFVGLQFFLGSRFTAPRLTSFRSYPLRQCKSAPPA